MKKTFINLAVSTALLAGAVSAQAASDTSPAGASRDNTSRYVGLGVGAAAGAIVAGPVGLVIGGIVGAVAGRHGDQAHAAETAIAAAGETGTETTAAIEAADTAPADAHSDAPSDAPKDTLIVASAAAPEAVMTGNEADHSARLRQILTTDLSLDVYFRSGSTRVEAFYAPRLQAIAALMREMPLLEIHIDGYADRRGDGDQNLALSNQRLDAVRAQLVQAGIDDSRIHGEAHGENRFVSAPGDLEAYTFDRRVVIRFEQAVQATRTPVASIADLPLM